MLTIGAWTRGTFCLCVKSRMPWLRASSRYNMLIGWEGLHGLRRSMERTMGLGKAAVVVKGGKLRW